MKALLSCYLGLGCCLLAVASTQEPPETKDLEVARWLKQLRSPERRVRMEAAYLLTDPGQYPRTRVAALVAALADADPTIRRYAASALGELAREPGQAVPALLKALQDPDRNVQQHAVLALVKTGRTAVPALIAALRREAEEEEQVGPLEFVPSHFGPRALEEFPIRWEALRPGTGTRRADYLLFALAEIGRPSVADLLKLFEDRHEPRQHDKALAALVRIGRPALANLVGALRHESRKVRRLAVATLSRIGASDKDAAAALAVLLRDKDEELAEDAGQALSRMGAEGLKVLLSALQEGNADLRLLSLSSLRTVPTIGREEVSPFVGGLTKSLTDPDARVRLQAARCLTHFHPQLERQFTPAATALTQVLRDDQVALRREAAQGLRLAALSLGKEAGDHVPALTAALADADLYVRAEAVAALGWTRAAAAPAVPKLTALLKDRNASRIHARVADALGKIGVAEEGAVTALIQVLRVKGDSYDTRRATIRALGRLNKDPRAGKALLEAFQDDPEHLAELGSALAASGPSVLPALATSLKDPRDRVRMEAFRAVRGLAKSAAAVPLVPVLQAGLQDKTWQVREAAAQALGELGKAAHPAVPALVATLPDSDPDVKVAAAQALGKLGPEAPGVVASLIKIIGDPKVDPRMSFRVLARIDQKAAAAVLANWVARDPVKDNREFAKESVRVATTLLNDHETLAWLGEPILPSLLEALKHGPVRSAAISAVVALGPRGHAAVPELVGLSRDQDGFIRFRAVQVLGQIGPGARSAVPALLRALQDEEPNVRRAAAVALRSVRPEEKAISSALVEALADPLPDVRVEAARTVVQLGLDAKSGRKLLTTVINDRFIEGYYRRVVVEALFRSTVVGATMNLDFMKTENLLSDPHTYAPPKSAKNGAGPTVEMKMENAGGLLLHSAAPPSGMRPASAARRLPEFPWPPPINYRPGQLIRESLGTDRAFLYDIHRYLLQELQRADFGEPRLFQVSSGPETGFALMTPLEPIGANARRIPANGPRGSPHTGSADLLDQLGSLQLGPIGFYRTIAFVIVREHTIPQAGPPLDAAQAGELAAQRPEDLKELPMSIGELRFAGYHCHVLIYEYERSAVGSSLVSTPGSPRKHLEAAGLKLKLVE